MTVSTSVSAKLAAAVTGFVPQAQQWVKLRDRISEYSAEEALLLCEEAEGRWLAWVPDHGEAVLDRGQIFQS
ncbi:MAG: hypothetical protein F6K04_13690 [Leptolyngbya sp. SIO4C5]|nr:hypothetical protein [Leptolyngbya sp. SIO4C5]